MYVAQQPPTPPAIVDPGCKYQVRVEYNVYRCFTEAEYQTITAARAAQNAASWQAFKSGPWPLVITVAAVALFLVWLFTPSGPEIVRISPRR